MADTLVNHRDRLADALGISSLEVQDAPTRFLVDNLIRRAQQFLYQNYRHRLRHR